MLGAVQLSDAPGIAHSAELQLHGWAWQLCAISTAEASDLRSMQDQYGFKAHEFHAAGFDSREDFIKAHGSDLYMTDIGEYDRICKVGHMQGGTDELHIRQCRLVIATALGD